ncbi:SdpI family protein [Kordiimonas sp.]|uniref:SdpI family protein n=1 Tax=Kordiimonas sp. TaxID=1970157 RepID=UPI003A94941E
MANLSKFKLAWGVTAATLVASVIGYMTLGDVTEIPVHWNMEGEVDGTASPLMALGFMPVMQVVIIFLFSMLSFIEPRKANIENSAKAISATVTATVVLLSAVQAGIIFEAHGIHVMNATAITVALGLLLAVVGNYLSKLRSSFFVGFRTPWTLSSDVVWQKTHRLAGKLFVAAGMTSIVAALLAPADIALKTMMCMIVIATLVPAVYSWAVWRQETQGDTK